ncbi:MAG: histidinol-phosphate transaminase [Deltaproteobacteria bacterium]|nr:histidinol-phosphate transaminase [Deltaproteobacteria bacterium]
MLKTKRESGAVSAAGCTLFGHLVSPRVLDLKSYVPGKPIEELQREKGLQRVVKLASNENPLGPSPAGAAAYQAEAARLHRYPDGYGLVLKQALARHWGVGVDQVVLGNGSSEILEMVVRLVVRPGRTVVVASPSFSIYEITTHAQGGAMVSVPLRDHVVDLEAVRAAVDGDTALVILANPNNPTGTVFRRKAWERFLTELPEGVTVLLDEAYTEFVSDPDVPVGRNYLDESRPLVVARTFSKAYGLAGLRIGYGLAPRELVDYMNRLRLPFNANGPAQAAAAAALSDEGHLTATARVNREGLERLGRLFDSLGVTYLPSQANFVLARVGPADWVFEALLNRGVIVRSAASFGLPEWIRVSVGLPEELDLFAEAFRDVLAGVAGAPGE